MADNILGKLGEAVVLLRADGSKLSEDLKKEKAKLEKDLDSISSNLKSVGKGLTVGVTAPILAMGTAAVAAGFKLDEAFDTIRIQTGATGDALAGLEEDFKAVFADVPDDAKTVADTLSLLNTRLGLTGEGLQTLTEQLLTMSRITETDVKGNVEAATKTFAAWGIETTKQGEALDFVFKVSQNTGASVTDLMETVSRSQGVFKALNYSFEDSVVLLGQMNKAGVDSGSAIMSLNKAVGKFAEANVPAREGLEKTFKLIKELGPGTQATSLAIDVFGTKAGPQLAAAIQQGRLSVDELKKVVEGSSETIKKAADDTDGFAERMKKFGNKMTIALEPLGTKLIDIAERALPYLEKLGDIALNLANWFSKLPGPVQDTSIALAALLAAAGPVVYIAGSLIGSYASVASAWGIAAKAASMLGKQMPVLASGLGLVAKGASVAAVAFAGWEFGKWLGEVSGATDGVEYLTGKLMGLSDAEIQAGYNARRQSEALKGQIKPSAEVAAATAKLEQDIKALGEQHANTEVDLKTFQTQLTKNKSAAEEYNDKVQDLVKSFGKDIVNQGKLYIDVLKGIGGTQKLTNAELKQFGDVLDDAYTKMKLLGQTAGPEFERVRQAWVDVQTAILNRNVSSSVPQNLPGAVDVKDFLEGARNASIRAASRELNSKINNNLFNTLFGNNVTLQAPPSLGKSFANSILSSFTGKGGFTEQFGPIILQALTGGGSVSKSIGALAGQQIGKSLTDTFSGTISKTLGKTIGGAISSMLPGIGALVGPLIGKGIAAIGNLFAGMFGNKTKGGREDLAKSMGFGNLSELYSDLQSLGAEGERLAHIGLNVIGRNDEAGNKRWMEDVKKFYDDVAAKKQQALDDELDARNKLQQAIDKYGFSIEELGPKWKQQRMTEKAQELIEDFTVLTASGIDVNTVIEKMAGSINEFVQLALRTGTEVPEAMKPMLQRMIDMGLLVDENGDKIEDLEGSGITFSTTLTQGFKGIIDKLDELIRKITGDLTTGLENIPSPTVSVDVEYNYGPLRPPDRQPNDPYDGYDPGNPDQYPQLSEGGFANWGRGTLAVLHDREAVMPIDDLMNMVMSVAPKLEADDITKSLLAAGLHRPNINFAPRLEGALANEMYDFAQKMWPIFIRVLQDNGSLNGSLNGTLGVEQ